MLAAVLEAPGRRLVVGRVADPHAGDGAIVVRVGRCGVCGSDLHAAAGLGPMPGALPAGTVLGHEFSGEVVEVDDGPASRWRVGDRVAGFPVFGCGSCASCRDGHPAHCRSARFLGFSGIPGAFAEYARASAAHSVPIAPHVSFEAAALAEPLAVCIHAARFAGELRGASVLVVGAGPIGLLLAMLCRRGGARDVVVSDLVAARAVRALALGADAAVDASREDTRERFRAATGRRPTVIFDAAGSAGSLDHAVGIAGARARIVVVAPHPAPTSFATATAFRKELSIAFAKAYTTGAFREACVLIENGGLDPVPVVSGSVGFDAFPAAFERLGRPNASGKVMLDPLSLAPGHAHAA